MFGRTLLWPRMHRHVALSSGSVRSLEDRSSADFIITTAGYNYPRSQSYADEVFGKDSQH